jgi:hypothetical protein
MDTDYAIFGTTKLYATALEEKIMLAYFWGMGIFTVVVCKNPLMVSCKSSPADNSAKLKIRLSIGKMEKAVKM